jgi:hypothetical protein
VIGGWIAERYHYEWCDWVSAIWWVFLFISRLLRLFADALLPRGALVLISTALFLPETFAPYVLVLKPFSSFADFVSLSSEILKMKAKGTFPLRSKSLMTR